MVHNKSYIQVTVVYAQRDKQIIQTIQAPSDSTILEVIHYSKIIEMCPEINLSKQTVGVFGRRRQLNDLINEGDQIEIYRPLLIDPKKARQLRVARSRKTDLINGRRWQQSCKK